MRKLFLEISINLTKYFKSTVGSGTEQAKVDYKRTESPFTLPRVFFKERSQNEKIKTH